MIIVLKFLRKKIGEMLRIMADKISGEKENENKGCKRYFGRLTAGEIESAWRRAAEKVGPFKFPEGVEILK